MNHSPKLREAMKEFKALLEKHDIGGVIILFEPTNGEKDYSEYHIGVKASWSCATYQDDRVRVRSRLDKDYGGDKKRHAFEARATAAMVTHFIDVSEFLRSQFASLKRLLTQKWDITHDNKGEMFPGTHNE